MTSPLDSSKLPSREHLIASEASRLQEDAPLWIPLPENGDERATFDKGTQLHGDVRLNIANMLRIFGIAQPGGSFADQCWIMANEVAKLGGASAQVQGEAVELLKRIQQFPENMLGTTLLSGDVRRFLERVGSTDSTTGASNG